MLMRVCVPETGVQHKEEDCKININFQDEGIGTLYVSEEKLVWANSDCNGLSLRYKDIAIHAVSKDTENFPEECLYVMYNGEISSMAVLNGNGHNTDDSDAAEDASSEITEIRFVPRSSESLQRMFDAMSDCQCLHPDTEDSDDYYDGAEAQGEPYEGADYSPLVYDDGGAAEGFYTSEEGFRHLTPQGQATLERLENMLSQTQVSEPMFPAMEGVIVEEEDKPSYREDAPVIGRTRDGSDEERQSQDADQPEVDGQFDDAE